MAYADQQMSGNRMVAIVIVALLHVAIGYTLVTGLAYEAAKSVVERVTTIDVEEPEPEEEEPPPEPEEIPETAPPPVVIPPPPFKAPTDNRLQDTTDKVDDKRTQTSFTAKKKTCADGRQVDENVSCGPEYKECPDGTRVLMTATCPRVVDNSAPATPRGNPSRWVTNNDYPSRSLREEEEGVTSVTLTIDASGRVSNCRVSGSSGFARLDEATCKNMERRARFNPAKDKQGNPTTGTYSQSVRWQMPQ